MSVSDFESNRQDVLTQRLRNARSAGSVPMWRSTDSDTRAARTVSARASVLYDGGEDLQPEQAEPSTASCVAKKPAPTDASLVSTTSGCATVVCAIALVVLIVYVVKMMAHRSTYSY